MLAMIFDKPSTRTRVSFDVGMRELGGETIMLTGTEMQLGRGETIADTARVLSRYVDAIMIRILTTRTCASWRAYATVPVINGLTKRTHPCQIMADVLTFEEHRGPIKGAHRRLDRRRQQRARELDPRRAALRFLAARRDAGRTRARQVARRLGEDATARGSRSPTIRSRRRRAPIASSPTAGCRWATRKKRAAGTIFSRPIRSTRASWASPRRTRSSCIACPPIAARKSPTR